MGFGSTHAGILHHYVGLKASTEGKGLTKPSLADSSPLNIAQTLLGQSGRILSSLSVVSV